MFAVVKTGGQQFRVSQGEKLRVNYIEGDVGGKVELDQVLMLGGDKTVIGSPMVSGAKVSATISAQERGDKILIFKFKRRKGYMLKKGHRQKYTVLEIGKISS